MYRLETTTEMLQMQNRNLVWTIKAAVTRVLVFHGIILPEYTHKPSILETIRIFDSIRL